VSDLFSDVKGDGGEAQPAAVKEEELAAEAQQAEAALAEVEAQAEANEVSDQLGDEDQDGSEDELEVPEAAELDAVNEAVVETPAEPEEEDPYRKFRQELREQPGKWYVVHSYAGYERRVKQNIETRAQALPGGDDILQIEVPMEETIEIKKC